MNHTSFRRPGSSGTPQQEFTCARGNKRKYDGRIQGTKKRRAGGMSNSHTPVRVDSLEVPGFRCYAGNNNIVARMLAIGQFIEQLQRTPTMVDLVSEMMIHNPMNLAVQLSGIRLLSECGNCHAETVVHTITQAMQANPGSLMLQLEGSAALRRRIKLDGGSLHFYREGEPLNGVIDAMILHAHSRHLCFLGFDIIGMLVTSSANHRQAVANNERYMGSLLTMIRANLSDASVLQVGLSMLSWIVEERQGRDTIVDKGGVVLVLDAMKQHPEDLLVQCNAAACLCWLIHTRNAQARETLVAGSDGIRLLLDSLNRYSSSPSIFGNIMCILIGALIADTSRRDFQNAEMVALAVRGMKQHEDSRKVRCNCLTLLRLLTMDSQTCQRMVLEHIAPIRAAMQHNLEDCDTQAEACGILANICLLPEGLSKISENGCIETVVTSQLQHGSCLRLQQIAALFHTLLASNTVEEGVFAFGGGIHNVVQAMFTGTSLMQR
jgi:hypothetical protein